MASQMVAVKLQQLGIIKDAFDFDQYLTRNGFDGRINVGTYTVRSDMTYLQLARRLMALE